MFGPATLYTFEPSLSTVPERVTRPVAFGSVPVPVIVGTEAVGV